MLKRIFLIVLALVFPPLAVLLHSGLSLKVLWAFLLWLLGHVPGVVYAIIVITRD